MPPPYSKPLLLYEKYPNRNSMDSYIFFFATFFGNFELQRGFYWKHTFCNETNNTRQSGSIFYKIPAFPKKCRNLLPLKMLLKRQTITGKTLLYKQQSKFRWYTILFVNGLSCFTKSYVSKWKATEKQSGMISHSNHVSEVRIWIVKSLIIPQGGPR